MQRIIASTFALMLSGATPAFAQETDSRDYEIGAICSAVLSVALMDLTIKGSATEEQLDQLESRLTLMNQATLLVADDEGVSEKEVQDYEDAMVMAIIAEGYDDAGNLSDESVGAIEQCLDLVDQIAKSTPAGAAGLP